MFVSTISRCDRDGKVNFVDISCVSAGRTHSILVTSEATRHLVELRVVDEVGSVSMNQGAEGQAVLPASPAAKQREPTGQCKAETY